MILDEEKSMATTQAAPGNVSFPDYDSPSALRAFLGERGLGARKQFGQNFLVNGAIRRRLVDALGIAPGDAVWEIGPGLGAMTALLLERGARVTAFEIDSGFSRVLRELFGGNPRFTLVEGDALKTWRYIIEETSEDQPLSLLGNLPYNVGARLLGDLIEGPEKKKIAKMVVTVQKEVAQRMSAQPRTKDYSSFSVLCASAYTVTPLMTLKGACFYPAPHVDSQALRLDLRPGVVAYPACFYPLIRRLFASRRKTIAHNLRGFPAAADIPALLTRCGIAPDARAEELPLEVFTFLASSLHLKPQGDWTI
jgi:16S rRNA (adenine1518-N6/adenine1519-N6)-dimethyltransferase